MTQSEKRLYLIKELLAELPQYRNMKIPDQTEEQKRLLRSLMNIRSPRPIGTEFHFPRRKAADIAVQTVTDFCGQMSRSKK